jgi:hypothetical protein
MAEPRHHEEALVAGATPEAIVPPGQARWLTPGPTPTSCRADVSDDDHEEMQASEANPYPGSSLGQCADHERQRFRPRAHQAADTDVRSGAMTILQQRTLHIWGISPRRSPGPGVAPRLIRQHAAGITSL